MIDDDKHDSAEDARGRDADDDGELTAAGGGIVVGEHLRGALWVGQKRLPRARPLVILITALPFATARDDIQTMIGFDVPGLAPLEFVGYADGDEITADEYLERYRKGKRRPPTLVVEIRPDGNTLVDAEPLATGEVVSVGISLCDTIIGWAERRESLTAGLRPDTVYVTGELGKRYYSGATPRVFLLSDESEAADAQVYVSPLAPSSFNTSLVDATFMVAQVIWFAATREHAYVLDGRRNAIWNMEEDRKRPFTGNPEIGALLERVLVFDEDKRIDVHALRAGLVELAQRWGVEMPPFPPPGLAD